MSVGSIDYSKNRIETPLPAEKEAVDFKYKATAGTLDEIFANDQIIGKSLKTPREKEPLGLFKLLTNLLKPGKKSQISPIIDKNTHVESIQFTPTLDAPAQLPPTLKNFKLPGVSEPSCQLSDEQVFEGLSNLSDYTMHQIMTIVLTTQNELAREGALICMDDFEQFQKMQVYQQKVLKEIKVALLKDESLRGLFKTVQNVSVAVGVVATLASFLGVTIPFAFAAAAVSGAVSIGGKSYYGVQSDKNSAICVDLNHKMKISKARMNEATERMEESVQDNNSEKVLGKLLRDQLKMIEMIQKR